MKKGHYTGTNAPSSMRHGPGPVAGAGMVRMASPAGKGMGINTKSGSSKAAGTNMTVGSKSTPKGMKIQRSGE